MCYVSVCGPLSCVLCVSVWTIELCVMCQCVDHYVVCYVSVCGPLSCVMCQCVDH